MYLIYILNSIVDIHVSITPPGTGTAGESYSLECTVNVTGSTDQPTITWLDPMNSTVSSGVLTTGSVSTLTLNPLAASHAGTYTCRATLGSAVQTEEMTVTVLGECSTAVFCVLSLKPLNFQTQGSQSVLTLVW